MKGPSIQQLACDYSNATWKLPWENLISLLTSKKPPQITRHGFFSGLSITEYFICP